MPEHPDREAIAEAVVDLMHPGGRAVYGTRRIPGGKPYDREEYVAHWRSPDDSSMRTFVAEDGQLSMRASTIREMVDLTLDAIAKVAENPVEE